jgi:hypothetical protein
VTHAAGGRVRVRPRARALCACRCHPVLRRAAAPCRVRQRVRRPAWARGARGRLPSRARRRSAPAACTTPGEGVSTASSCSTRWRQPPGYTPRGQRRAAERRASRRRRGSRQLLRGAACARVLRRAACACKSATRHRLCAARGPQRMSGLQNRERCGKAWLRPCPPAAGAHQGDSSARAWLRAARRTQAGGARECATSAGGTASKNDVASSPDTGPLNRGIGQLFAALQDEEELPRRRCCLVPRVAALGPPWNTGVKPHLGQAHGRTSWLARCDERRCVGLAWGATRR